MFQKPMENVKMLRLKKVMSGMYSYNQIKGKSFLIIKNGKEWEIKLNGAVLATKKNLNDVRMFLMQQ